MRTLLILLLFLVQPIWSQSVSSDEETKEKAQELILRYFDCLKVGNYAGTADLMDENALQVFKMSMLPSVLKMSSIDKLRPTLSLWFGASSEDELAAMPPKQFYGRFVTYLCTAENTKALMQNSQLDIMGCVVEDKNINHFVYRLAAANAGAELSKVETISVRRDGDNYGILLTGNCIDFIEQLKQRLANLGSKN